MTREEAIEYLKRADITVGQKIKTKTAEALELAIRSLEAWDKVRTEMQDIMIVSQDEERIYQQIKAIIDKYKAESEDKE